MIQVATVKSIRDIDKDTIESGISAELLMEEAGEGIANLAEEFLSDNLENKTTLVVCGKGNNAGDGFVAARLLSKVTNNITLVLLAKEEDLKEEALLNYSKLKDLNLEIIIPKTVTELPDFRTYDLIIDAIFGVGFKGELKGLIKDTANLINDSGSFIIAVDIPSGINCDTGECSDNAILADTTMTFGLPKIGQFAYPAKDLLGELQIKDIGLDITAKDKHNLNIHICNNKDITQILPLRYGNAYKSSVGKVLIIAGSKGLTGAAVLSAKAALESGAGVVTCLIPSALEQILEIKLTEEMTIGIGKKTSYNFTEEDSKEVLKIAKDFDSIVLGPGIGRKLTTCKFVKNIVKNSPCPIVLDADGLFAFNKNVKELLKNKNLVLTPHIGEFLKLFKNAEILTPLKVIETLKDLSQKGYKILLKGAPTYISFKDEPFILNITGNSGMATAGSGDVLTGFIASLIAQGISLFDATVCAAYLHGLSGDLALQDRTEFCLKASNLIDFLPQAFKEVLDI